VGIDAVIYIIKMIYLTVVQVKAQKQQIKPNEMKTRKTREKEKRGAY